MKNILMILFIAIFGIKCTQNSKAINENSVGNTHISTDTQFLKEECIGNCEYQTISAWIVVEAQIVGRIVLKIKFLHSKNRENENLNSKIVGVFQDSIIGYENINTRFRLYRVYVCFNLKEQEITIDSYTEDSKLTNYRKDGIIYSTVQKSNVTDSITISTTIQPFYGGNIQNIQLSYDVINQGFNTGSDYLIFLPHSFSNNIVIDACRVNGKIRAGYESFEKPNYHLANFLKDTTKPEN
jgi:hypothetical protein